MSPWLSSCYGQLWYFCQLYVAEANSSSLFSVSSMHTLVLHYELNAICDRRAKQHKLWGVRNPSMLCCAVGVAALAALALLGGLFCIRRRRRSRTGSVPHVADPEKASKVRPAAAASDLAPGQSSPDKDNWPGVSAALQGPLLRKEGSGTTNMTSTGAESTLLDDHFASASVVGVCHSPTDHTCQC